MDDAYPSTGIRYGKVTAFDHERGLGTLLDVARGAEFGFHATAIGDGSRTIRLGAIVVFTVAPGHLGRYEAEAIDTFRTALVGDGPDQAALSEAS